MAKKPKNAIGAGPVEDIHTVLKRHLFTHGDRVAFVNDLYKTVKTPFMLRRAIEQLLEAVENEE